MRAKCHQEGLIPVVYCAVLYGRAGVGEIDSCGSYIKHIVNNGHICCQFMSYLLLWVYLKLPKLIAFWELYGGQTQPITNIYRRSNSKDFSSKYLKNGSKSAQNAIALANGL